MRRGFLDRRSRAVGVGRRTRVHLSPSRHHHVAQRVERQDSVPSALPEAIALQLVAAPPPRVVELRVARAARAPPARRRPLPNSGSRRQRAARGLDQRGVGGTRSARDGSVSRPPSPPRPGCLRHRQTLVCRPLVLQPAEICALASSCLRSSRIALVLRLEFFGVRAVPTSAPPRLLVAGVLQLGLWRRRLFLL